jgi:hypothetical protein
VALRWVSPCGLVVGVLGALAAACVSNVEPKGGERLFDASAPVASLVPDAGPAAPLSTNTGHTFTSLYNDYFAPTGAASCAGDGLCHGGASEPGALSTAFVCTDKATCFSTLGAKVSGLVVGEPRKTGLYTVLRQAGGGSMPKRPAGVVFQPSDLKRIEDWLAAGSPDD